MIYETFILGLFILMLEFYVIVMIKNKVHTFLKSLVSKSPKTWWLKRTQGINRNYKNNVFQL